MKKYIIPILHLVVFLIAITSPFWIDWRIVLAGFILYELQLLLFKGCILSYWEFGRSGQKPKERFIVYYLKYFFKNIDASKADLYLDLIVPLAVPVLAAIWQLVFNFPVIINLQ